MRKQNSDFEARFISEEGSRLKNRDYFGYVELDEFACYVIADGITEVTDVESARLAIETVILSFQENPSLSKRAVKRLLKRANRALLGKESDRRLKASITVVVTDYQKMIWVCGEHKAPHVPGRGGLPSDEGYVSCSGDGGAGENCQR